MKKFIVLVAMFAGVMAMATTFEGNLGPPVDAVETTTMAEILDQNGVFVNAGWDATEIKIVQAQTFKFVTIMYERRESLGEIPEQLFFASKPVVDLIEDRMVEQIFEYTRPKQKIPDKYIIPTGTQPQVNIGSAGGEPSMCVTRVTHA